MRWLVLVGLCGEGLSKYRTIAEKRNSSKKPTLVKNSSTKREKSIGERGVMEDQSFNEEDFKGKFKEEYKKYRSSISKPNILVMGGTGTGKSSLVNMVFGEERAQVGAGEPVTSGIKPYESEFVTIYDSEGYESGKENQNKYKENIVKFVTDREGKLEKQIHLVWYCISFASHRIWDIDIELVKEIKYKKIPIAVIFTQADVVSDEDAEKLIQTFKESCPGVPVFEVSKDPELGLSVEDLIDWAYENIDESVRHAFITAVKRGFNKKNAEAKNVIKLHSGIAASSAATPVPFSDAPLLVANQVTMLAKITSIWDIQGVDSIVSGGTLGQISTQVGRTLVGNLAKLIPGAGQAAGYIINASVASGLTAAIGWAVNDLCYRYKKDMLDGKNVDIQKYFDSEVLQELIKQYMKKEL
ncbi:YcjF family protein [Thiohalorhabdus denitrificans]|uniref:YcjF family protein n=1 Tax=Thiohalorhabdus denitrificans TaxID=381306 RepID=UPI0015A225DD|nr:GTPase [Thiohalorhabdus denitrificans]